MGPAIYGRGSEGSRQRPEDIACRAGTFRRFQGGGPGIRMISDSFGQLGPVRNRPRKGRVFWAFLGPSGISDSSAGHFRSGEFVWHLSADPPPRDLACRRPHAPGRAERAWPGRAGPGRAGPGRAGWTMHIATDAGLYLKPLCLSITIVNMGDRNVLSDDGAFRYSDFWRSRRGHSWWATVAVIPWPVYANPSAGSAIIGHRRWSAISSGCGSIAKIPATSH